jgi:hypothetical protein
VEAPHRQVIRRVSHRPARPSPEQQHRQPARQSNRAGTHTTAGGNSSGHPTPPPSEPSPCRGRPGRHPAADAQHGEKTASQPAPRGYIPPSWRWISKVAGCRTGAPRRGWCAVPRHVRDSSLKRISCAHTLRESPRSAPFSRLREKAGKAYTPKSPVSAKAGMDPDRSPVIAGWAAPPAITHS